MTFPLMKDNTTSSLPEEPKQKQSPAEPRGTDHNWPLRRRETEQRSELMSRTKNYITLSQEQRSKHGSRDSGVFNKSSAAIRKTTALLSSAVHSLNGLRITGPARSTKRTVPEVANSNEVRPHRKGYCEFHRDYGHRTDDCIQLKREIEYLIWRGYLRRFISPESQPRNQPQNQPQNQAQNQALAKQPPPPPRQTTTQHQQPLREIHVISGGFAGGGESSSARKAHLRSIRSAGIGEIQAVSKLPRLDTSITFSESDLEGC